MSVKISVITVCFNSEATIADTISSVWAQDYENFEYIVIDGKSRDSTLQIVEASKDSRLRLISEPDAGIYDAMNKGLRLAKGDVVAFLNSDDFYSTPDVLSQVAREFSSSHCQILYGDLEYVKRSNTQCVVRKWNARPFSAVKIYFGWHPPHPSFFIRRDVIPLVGCFDMRYRISSDYDFMCRALRACRLQVSYLPKTLVKMRTGGESGRSMKHILIANLECALSAFRSRNPLFWLVPVFKPLTKLRQLKFN